MSSEKPTIIGKTFRFLLKPFDLLRKFLHLLLLIMIFAFFMVGMSGNTPKPLAEPMALMFSPNGVLVEQLSGDPVNRAIAEAQGQPINETLVVDVVTALEAAKDDANVQAMVMDVSRLSAGAISLSKLKVVASAIEDFKASGKKIYAYSEMMSQGQYYLASLADEVYLHPEGALLIEGFGRYRMYMREAIEKLSVDWNVFKVGEYKSFVEPYLRDDMSEEDKAASQMVIGTLWDAYTQDVEQARGLEAGALNDYANNFASSVTEQAGDLAKVALSAGLVDELMDRVAFRKKMVELVGQKKNSDSFKSFGFDSYIALQKSKPKELVASKDKVAVIVAAGNIMDGSQPSGSIGGDSTAKVIRDAMNDESVKALVLKIDSGGGSAFASDIILDALNEFKATDRPVITAMSSVAASGGYMISLAGDEIWATPTSVTGSIGIFGMIPTFDRSLKRLGLTVDGIGTTNLSGALEFGRPLSDDVKQILQASINDGYDDFISKVAEARGMTKEAVDKVGRGRVWVAKDAIDFGLVDKLGSFEEAVDRAAELAEIDEYQIKTFEKELTFKEQLAINFVTRFDGIAEDFGYRQSQPEWKKGVSGEFLQAIENQLAEYNRFNDPMGVYMDCLCVDIE